MPFEESFVHISCYMMTTRNGGNYSTYILLNLILSMVAALQAPIILMSQNRQAMRDRLAASLDYEVNLKAEIEIMALHDKLDQFRLGHLEELIIDLQGRVNSATELLKRIAV
jgi:uncharacterized membrane protein